MVVEGSCCVDEGRLEGFGGLGEEVGGSSYAPLAVV